MLLSNENISYDNSYIKINLENWKIDQNKHQNSRIVDSGFVKTCNELITNLILFSFLLKEKPGFSVVFVVGILEEFSKNSNVGFR